MTLIETFNLAVENHQKNNLKGAQILYNQILKIDPHHASALGNLGSIYGQLGENQKAINCFEKAVEIKPNYADAYFNLGVIFKKLKKNKKAKSCYERVLEIDPNNAEPYNNLGVIFYELSEYQKAKDCYERAIKINPNHANAYRNLGIIFKYLLENQKAKDCYERSIEINPNYAEAHNNLGVIFHELREYQKAINCYEKAIEINPRYAETCNNLGVIFKELGENQKAKNYFERAIEIDPNHANAIFNLGSNLKALGEFSKSAKFFEQFLKIYPEDHLGAILELATMGKKDIPNKTPKNFLQNFYHKKSKGWDTQKTSSYLGHELIENAFKQNYKEQEKIDILDLGCGTGSLAGFLRPYARRLIGLDLSKDMIVEAEKKGLYDTLLNKELDKYLAETSSQYDAVIAAAVMIHFFDLENTFTLIRNSLKKDGKFIFSVFKGEKKDKELNSFLMYSHSDSYINTLADRLKFKINYKQSGVHEYQNGNPVDALIYVLQKNI